MFTIRNGQMNAFEAEARAKFLDALVPILKEGSGVHDVPEATMRQEIETLAVQAETFGLRSLDNIGLYIVIANDVGYDFWDVFTAPYEVLTSSLLNEDTKASWLEKWHTSLGSAEVPDNQSS